MDIDANKIGSTGQNTGDSSSVKKPKREEVDFKSVFETDYETSFENDDLDNVKAEDIFSKFTDEEYKTLDIDEQVDFLEDPSFNFDISDYDAVEAGEEGNNDSFLRKALGGISGSASPHINVGDIKAFAIILPPIALQEQFVTFVEQTDKSKLYGEMEVAA